MRIASPLGPSGRGAFLSRRLSPPPPLSPFLCRGGSYRCEARWCRAAPPPLPPPPPLSLRCALPPRCSSLLLLPLLPLLLPGRLLSARSSLVPGGSAAHPRSRSAAHARSRSAAEAEEAAARAGNLMAHQPLIPYNQLPLIWPISANTAAQACGIRSMTTDPDVFIMSY